MHSIIRNIGSITEPVPHLLLFKDPLASFRMSKRSGNSKIVTVIIYIVCRRELLVLSFWFRVMNAVVGRVGGNDFDVGFLIVVVVKKWT